MTTPYEFTPEGVAAACGETMETLTFRNAIDASARSLPPTPQKLRREDFTLGVARGSGFEGRSERFPAAPKSIPPDTVNLPDTANRR